MNWHELFTKAPGKTFGATGFYFKRAKGSHQIYYNPISNKTIIVPVHGGKDIKKGTFHAILKQAGIDISEV